MKCLGIGAALLLTGCAMFQPSANLSAEQIEAANKNKSAMVVCNKVQGPWGTAETIVITLDQQVIRDGGVSGTNSNGCTASINNATPQPQRPTVQPLKPQP